MYGVSECVSDMQTTRALLGATVVVGGFITTLMTRCVLLISFHAAVGSLVSGCTAMQAESIVHTVAQHNNQNMIVTRY